MSDVPPPPVPGDDRDWTFVITDGCVECGFRPVPVADLPDWLVERSSRWREPLTRHEVAERPEPGVWSALEYGRHVQDMLVLLKDRVYAMLAEQTPMLADWDGDAQAVELEYWKADPLKTLVDLQRAAVRAGTLLGSVSGVDWERTGLRSDGMSFTVAAMSQYIAHEMEHHLHDVGA